MRALLLTQYFTPEPAEKWQELAVMLRDAGHEVEVLTGFPCYPLGKIYPGYRQKLFAEEQIDGVRVVRAPQFADHSSSAVRRIAYYVSFAISAVFVGLLRVRRPDVVVVYQSAAPIGLTAWVLSRVWRRPYLLDVADLWPESVAASGMLKSKNALSVIRAVMRFIYRRARTINVITQGYRESLLRLGVPAQKIHVTYCWPSSDWGEASRIDHGLARREGLLGRFNVLYAGAIGPCQDLGTVLDAAERLRDLPQVQFVLVGDGLEKDGLENRARQRGLDNVRFLGKRPPAEVRRMFPSADLLLVHLATNDMSRVSIPSKTFAYMASGRPLLMAVQGEATEIVERHRCGEVATPSDPGSLADAVRRHCRLSPAERASQAASAKTAYHQHYSREAEGPKLVRLIESAAARRGLYTTAGKRAIDLLAAGMLLAAFSPAILLIWLAVRKRLGSPALFRQRRPGLFGKTFELVKFRTMSDARDETGELLPDELRLGAFGRLLRASSLDELPQLWNVLRGDMSLVGPRPLLEEYLPLYSDRQSRRHEVRPGITGLAQTSGRNGLSWESRLELDVQYVEKCSLRTDLKILFQTLLKVLQRDGVSATGHATCPKFEGSPSPPAPPVHRAA